MVIAEKQFIINSSQQRIWELLLKSVLRFMPFERMRPTSEKSVQALLRVKMGFISLPMDVDVEIVKASPPELLVTILNSRGMGGLINLKQKATFKLIPKDEDKTTVDCKIVAEEIGIIVRMFLLWRVRAIAWDSFQGLEERLNKWV